MKYTIDEINVSREYLNKVLKPGSTVYCVLRHVSRSGMTRHISLLIASDGEISDISWYASRVLGYPVNSGNYEGIKIGGCGMDMGFALVYNLARALYPDGWNCIGKGENYKGRCPSNDHSKGDQDYSPHTHRDGGYALKHRWL